MVMDELCVVFCVVLASVCCCDDDVGVLGIGGVVELDLVAVKPMTDFYDD